MGDQIPNQVRIRTDPDDDYGHRYEAIQRAKAVFDVGNNTGAIIAACEHARRDEQGKRKAMDYLARHVGDDILEEVAERLSTRSMPVETESTVRIGQE